MLDMDLPGAKTETNEQLQVRTKIIRAALEIRCWMPEHRSGARSILLDGRELPREVGGTLPAPIHILCLAPGEWLLVSDERSVASITEHNAGGLAAQGAVLVDTTDGLGVLTVRGLAARDVLSKGCGLDMRQHSFADGGCARTRFAQMQVIIHCIDEMLGFRLYVGRSHLRYLCEWIEDAAVEFNSSCLRPGTQRCRP